MFLCQDGVLAFQDCKMGSVLCFFRKMGDLELIEVVREQAVMLWEGWGTRG